MSKVSEEEISKLFGGIFTVDSVKEGSDDEDDDSPEAKEKREKLREAIAKAAVLPMASAVDFSDFNEMVEDSAQKRYLERGLQSLSKADSGLKPGGISRRGGDEDDYDNEDEEEEVKQPEPTQDAAEEPTEPVVVEAVSSKAEPTKAPAPLSLAEIKRAYPAFEPNSVLKFSDLFANPHFKKQKLDHHGAKKIESKACTPLLTSPAPYLEVGEMEVMDERALFESSEPLRRHSYNLLQELLHICRTAQQSHQLAAQDAHEVLASMIPH